uniref:Putative ovule protein n=1 Tax=Solanum chacoense TaxID=4108 RepID=A0A0V0I102_SOLCH
MLVNWPCKSIWKTKLSPKVICFSWLALLEASLTQDNLIGRKIHIVNRCFLCHQALETNRHLLHCPVATGIWNMFISVFGLKWVMPRSFKDALVS